MLLQFGLTHGTRGYEREKDGGESGDRTSRSDEAKGVAEGLVLARAEGGQPVGEGRGHGSIHIFVDCVAVGAFALVISNLEALEHIFTELSPSLFVVRVVILFLLRPV